MESRKISSNRTNSGMQFCFSIDIYYRICQDTILWTLADTTTHQDTYVSPHADNHGNGKNAYMRLKESRLFCSVCMQRWN